MSKLTPRQRLRDQRDRKNARVSNARNERFSGAGSQYDYGTNNVPAMPAWGLSGAQQDQWAIALYTTDWQAKKIIDIVVDDMLREGWEVKGLTPEQLKEVEKAQDSFAVLDAFRKAKRLEGLLGGSAIYMGVSDGQTDPSIELDYSTIQPGALKFLNVVPRSRITKVEFNVDSLSRGYGRSLHYWIQGQRVHRSRLILFTGDPLLDVPDSTIAWNGVQRHDGFGYSKLLAIMDDLTRATGSRQSAFQLVQRAGVFFAQTDDTTLDDGDDASLTNMAVLSDIVNQVNTFRGAVFKTSPGQTFPPISTITPTFGSVPELVMSFLQVLSAASDIPATRFLGQAPGGLNATGEADLENYYGRLESEQRQVLRPQLFQLMQVLVPSVLGAGAMDTGDIDITFPPLWSMSEKEEAEVEKLRADTLVALVEAGIVTTEEAAAEVNAREMFDKPLSGDAVAPEPPVADAPPLAESLAAMQEPV